MANPIELIEQRQLRSGIPPFKAGDTVKVHFQVIEGQRRRVQVFEGTVIKRQGAGARETFTVRKNSFGVGVERTFPVHTPKIEKIEVLSIGDVSRAKLYYLRDKVGKRARVRAKTNVQLPVAAAVEAPPPEEPELEAEPEAVDEAPVEAPEVEPEAAEPEAEAETAEPEAEAETAEPEAESEPEAEADEASAEPSEKS